MNYTSGTTGRPKGVRRPLAPIDPDTIATLFTGFLQMFGVKPEDGNVHIVGSPLYHTAVLMFASGSMHLGHPVVVMDKWKPEELPAADRQLQVTISHMVPTQLHRMLQLPEDVRAKYDVSSTRSMVHAAAPCPPEVKRRMLDWWGDSIWEYYAATEGGGTIVSPQEWRKKPGTVGKAWTNAEIKIFDDEGKELPPGTPGTVYMLRGQADFEYYKDKEKTDEGAARPLLHRRRHRLPRRGRLPLPLRPQDRHDHLGRREHLPRRDRERAARRIPKVADVAVFGIPHEEWGEQVKAVVQPIDGVARRRGADRRDPGLLPRPARQVQDAAARSTTSRRCRATRTASSTSASCAIPTGRDASARSRPKGGDA